MFNPREYLETIKVVIERRVNSRETTFALVVRNKQILCIPKSQVQKLDSHIRLLSTYLIEKGFNQLEWTQLERKIAKLQKGGLLS